MSYYGFRAIDEQVLEGAADNPIALRFAFLGACVSCDNVRSQRLFLRLSQLLHPGSRERMLRAILRDAICALCTSDREPAEVSEFLALCYFPREYAKIWSGFDFVALFRGTQRGDIIAYLANEGAYWIDAGIQWRITSASLREN